MTRWCVLLTLLIVFPHHSHVQAISEQISIANVTLMDHEEMVPVLLTSNSDTEQNFVYIIQVKDSDGYTMQLKLVNEIL